MRSLRYLNTVLTILAVLLTFNLWTLWTTTPAGEALSFTEEAHAQGIVNAGAQRKQMIDQLNNLNVKIDKLGATLTNGSVRVRIDDLPEEE